MEDEEVEVRDKEEEEEAAPEAEEEEAVTEGCDEGFGTLEEAEVEEAKEGARGGGGAQDTRSPTLPPAGGSRVRPA